MEWVAVEALILILGEMIFALLAPLVIAVIDLIGAAIAALLSFIPARRKEPRFSSQAARKLLIALLAIAGFIFASLFVINAFFFGDAVRMVFGTLERRAGIETECSSIEGNVFSGRIELGNCKVGRPEHPATEFQLDVERVAVDVRLSSLFGTAEIQTAYVSGLRGSVHRLGSNEAAADETQDRPRRAFVIEDLAVEDVAIDLSGFNDDGGRFELPVRVETATSAPLRSRKALFDILFRSNARGEIAGAEFEITTLGDSRGRQTTWSASGVPVAEFGALTGGLLSWFSDGVVDVHVEDRWQRDGTLEIDMDWQLNFRNIEVRPPATAGTMTKLATGPIVDYVNSRDGNFPFEFQMVVNEEQFAYRSSLAAAGLWTALGESINRLLSEINVDVTDTAVETGQKLKEGAKSVIDRLRKPVQEED